MNKYMPGADTTDSNYFTGMHQGVILETLLKQCGDDLSRANIAKQTRNIKGLALPMSLPESWSTPARPTTRCLLSSTCNVGTARSGICSADC